MIFLTGFIHVMYVVCCRIVPAYLRNCILLFNSLPCSYQWKHCIVWSHFLLPVLITLAYYSQYHNFITHLFVISGVEPTNMQCSGFLIVGNCYENCTKFTTGSEMKTSMVTKHKVVDFMNCIYNNLVMAVWAIVGDKNIYTIKGLACMGKNAYICHISDRLFTYLLQCY